MGGESLPALKRVAEFGNGWHIGPLTPAEITPKLNRLKQLMAEAGRNFSELEITALVDGAALAEEDIEAYRDVGVQSFYTLAAIPGPEAMLTHVREFAAKVKRAVG